jgi:glycosyltransferase involved in cell wall biosynthesis
LRSKILLLASAYPPFPVVGSQRAAKLARAFRDGGHEVTVVTTRLPDDQGRGRPAEYGVTVYPVELTLGPKRAYRRLKKRMRLNSAGEDENHSESARNGFITEQSRGSIWKRHLLSLLWLPDVEQGFILPAIFRSLGLLQRGTDLLYTTAPPFSAHLAGLILKAATNVRWVAEFRDPWTDYPGKPAYVRTAASDAVEAWLEQQCLASADHIVSVSEKIEELLLAKSVERRRDRFVVARNGIDSLSPLPANGTRGPFRILYVGELYHYRDPRPFLTALASLCRRRGLGADDIELEFLGQGRWYYDVSVERLAVELGIADRVRFRDRIPRRECLKAMVGADLLLLFAQKQPAQVPNKLYEYLGARRPIFALADSCGETAAMLGRVGGHFIVTEDHPQTIEPALEAALDSRGQLDHEVHAESVLREWSTEAQMANLRAALGL